jgi:hypothetical protein
MDIDMKPVTGGKHSMLAGYGMTDWLAELPFVGINVITATD